MPKVKIDGVTSVVYQGQIHVADEDGKIDLPDEAVDFVTTQRDREDAVRERRAAQIEGNQLKIADADEKPKRGAK